jgi:hypothetical protein
MGAQREALHSIFRRTCERNQLLVNDVVNDLMLPLAGPKPDRMRKLVKPLHLMNRDGVLSNRFVARMGAFSVTQSWGHATLKELIELTGVGFLPISSFRRWCAHCYDDDCSQQHEPYDRLLWSVDLVATCPVHQVRLEDSCGSCGATNLPLLMGVDISGFCPRCWEYLGGGDVRHWMVMATITQGFCCGRLGLLRICSMSACPIDTTPASRSCAFSEASATITFPVPMRILLLRSHATSL